MFKAIIKELAGAIVFAVMITSVVYAGLVTSPLYG